MRYRWLINMYNYLGVVRARISVHVQTWKCHKRNLVVSARTTKWLENLLFWQNLKSSWNGWHLRSFKSQWLVRHNWCKKWHSCYTCWHEHFSFELASSEKQNKQIQVVLGGITRTSKIITDYIAYVEPNGKNFVEMRRLVIFKLHPT